MSAQWIGAAYGTAYLLGLCAGQGDSFANKITEAFSTAAAAIIDPFVPKDQPTPNQMNVVYSQYKHIDLGSYTGKGMFAVCQPEDTSPADANFTNYFVEGKNTSNRPLVATFGSTDVYSVCGYKSYSSLHPSYTPADSAPLGDRVDLRWNDTAFGSMVAPNWTWDEYSYIRTAVVSQEHITGLVYGHLESGRIIVPGLNKTSDGVVPMSLYVKNPGGSSWDSLSTYSAWNYQNDEAFSKMYKDGKDWVAYSAATNGKTLGISRFIMPGVDYAESQTVNGFIDATVDKSWESMPLNLIAFSNLQPGKNPVTKNYDTYEQTGSVEVYTQSSPGTSILEVVEDPKDTSRYIYNPDYIKTLVDKGQDCPSLNKVCFSNVASISKTNKPALFSLIPSGSVKPYADIPKDGQENNFRTSGFGYARFVVAQQRGKNELPGTVVPGTKLAYQITVPVYWHDGKPYMYAPGGLAKVGVDHIVYYPGVTPNSNGDQKWVQAIDHHYQAVMTYNHDNGTLSFNLVDLSVRDLAPEAMPLQTSIKTQAGNCEDAVLGHDGMLTATCITSEEIVNDGPWAGYHSEFIKQKLSLPYGSACPFNSKFTTNATLISPQDNIIATKGLYLTCEDSYVPGGTYLNQSKDAYFFQTSESQAFLYANVLNPVTKKYESATLEYGEDCAPKSTVSIQFDGKINRLICDTKPKVSSSDLKWDDGVSANNPNIQCGGLSWTKDQNGDLWLKTSSCNVNYCNSAGGFSSTFVSNLSLNTSISCQKNDFVSLNLGEDTNGYQLANWNSGMVKLECKSSKSTSFKPPLK